MQSVCPERELDYIAAHFRCTLSPHWRAGLTLESGVQHGFACEYSVRLDAFCLVDQRDLFHEIQARRIFS
jgi:hypothetical protein